MRSEVFKKSFHMEGVWGHKPGVNNVLYGPPAGRWFPNYCPLALSQRNPNGPTRVRLSILRLLWTPLRESCVLRAGRAAGVVPPVSPVTTISGCPLWSPQTLQCQSNLVLKGGKALGPPDSRIPPQRFSSTPSLIPDTECARHNSEGVGI